MAMSFSLALFALKAGRKVARSGWNGKGMWLEIFKIHTHTPIQDGMTMLPFIAMKTADNHFVPWLASQTDVLVEDWELVGDEVMPPVSAIPPNFGIEVE